MLIISIHYYLGQLQFDRSIDSKFTVRRTFLGEPYAHANKDNCSTCGSNQNVIAKNKKNVCNICILKVFLVNGDTRIRFCDKNKNFKLESEFDSQNISCRNCCMINNSSTKKNSKK